jgi:hypothetical protein
VSKVLALVESSKLHETTSPRSLELGWASEVSTFPMSPGILNFNPNFSNIMEN